MKPLDIRRQPDRSLPPVRPCPLCKGRMVLRHNKATHEPFFGCDNYPKCTGTRDRHGYSKSEAQALTDDGHNRDDYDFEEQF